MSVMQITDQAMLDHLVEMAINGRELVAGLKRIPVAYDPRDSHDGLPFLDLATGDRYPVRQVAASYEAPRGNV